MVRMIEDMRTSGIQPTSATYNVLMSRLMTEGRLQDARTVMDTQMQAAGINADTSTREIFERPAEQWSRIRTQHLQRLQREATPLAREQAVDFFGMLKDNGAADVYHWTVTPICIAHGAWRTPLHPPTCTTPHACPACPPKKNTHEEVARNLCGPSLDPRLSVTDYVVNANAKAAVGICSRGCSQP